MTCQTALFLATVIRRHVVVSLSHALYTMHVKSTDCGAELVDTLYLHALGFFGLTLVACIAVWKKQTALGMQQRQRECEQKEKLNMYRKW